MKPPVMLVNQTYETWPMMVKFSKILNLQPVMAFVLRFKLPEKDDELWRSIRSWDVELLMSYRANRTERNLATWNLSAFWKSKEIETNSQSKLLNVILDENKILRVGVRLRNFKQPFETKHQIILSKNQHVTTILIRELHQDNVYVLQMQTLRGKSVYEWPSKTPSGHLSRFDVRQRWLRRASHTEAKLAHNHKGIHCNLCLYVNQGWSVLILN
jgi:hypothetical protein